MNASRTTRTNTRPARVPLPKFAPLLLLGTLSTMSCGESGTGPNPGPTVASVTITSAGPLSLTQPGQSQTLNVVARDADGGTIASASIQWNSSNTTVASVDSEGRVEAVGEGMAEITARSGSVTSDAVQVSVEFMLAELTVETASTSPATPDSDDQIRYEFVVRNTGEVTSGLFAYRAEVDGVVITSGTSTRAPGESLDVVVPDQPPLAVGPHTLRVVVDEADDVFESDETNNVAVIPFTVQVSPDPVPGVDLVAEAIVVRSVNATQDQVVETQIQFSNRGSTPTAQARWEIHVGGEVVSSSSLLALDPGETVTVENAVGPLPAGTHTLDLVLDPAGIVPEFSDENNVRSVTVAVGAGTGFTPLVSGVPISGITLGLGEAQWFRFDVPPGTPSGSVLQFEVGPSSALAFTTLDVWRGSPTGGRIVLGDCSLFLQPTRTPSCAIPSPASGEWYARLRGGLTNVQLTATLHVDVSVTSLGAGANLTGLASDAGEFQLFTIDVPNDATDRVLDVALAGVGGATELWLWPPETIEPACFTTPVPSPTVQDCSVLLPQPGTWTVGVEGRSSFSGASLDATVSVVPPLFSGQPISNLSGASNDLLLFKVEPGVPLAGGGNDARAAGRGPGANIDVNRIRPRRESLGAQAAASLDGRSSEAFHTGSTALEVTLTGGTGDADLIVLNAGSESLDCFSSFDGNGERCHEIDPTAPLFVGVQGFMTFAGVTIEAEFGDLAPVALQEGISTPLPMGGLGSEEAYLFQVPGGLPETTTLEFLSSGGSGSLFVTAELEVPDVPGSFFLRCTDGTGSTNTLCSVSDPTAGLWGVRYENAQNTSGVSLLARLRDERVATTLTVDDGEGQDAPAGSPVPTPPSIRVLDQFGDPLQNVPVLFAVASGGGQVTAPNATTDANGIARVGSWTLGSEPGGNSLVASVPDLIPVAVAADATGDLGNGMNIDVRFLSAVTPAEEAEVTKAAERWESILIGDLSDVNLIGSGVIVSCGLLHPVLNEIIDDLIIFIDITSIDGEGGTLGFAGPCRIRVSNGLATVGAMRLDQADVDRLLADGQFDDTVFHEMGHILGFGTGSPWGLLRRNPPQTPGIDTHFIGVRALDAFQAVGGDAFVGFRVPIEDTQGGGGTLGSHWKESVFDREIMTGFLDRNVPNPISLVTVQAMADLGYRVDANAADPYALPGPALSGLPSSGLRSSKSAISFGDDIWRGIVDVVDDQGRVVGRVDTRRGNEESDGTGRSRNR